MRKELIDAIKTIASMGGNAWREQQYTCATDHRILLACDGHIDEFDGKSGVKPNTLQKYAENYGKFAAVMQVHQPLETTGDPVGRPDEKCDDCKGSGWSRTCHNCDGDGDFECEECGHVDECKSCKGTGSIPCPPTGNDADKCECCSGRGIIQYDRGIKCGEVFLGVKYVGIMRAIGVKTIRVVSKQHPVMFEFDGGHGYLMPMSL